MEFLVFQPASGIVPSTVGTDETSMPPADDCRARYDSGRVLLPDVRKRQLLWVLFSETFGDGLITVFLRLTTGSLYKRYGYFMRGWGL